MIALCCCWIAIYPYRESKLMHVIEAAKSEPCVPDLPPDDIADGAFSNQALKVDAMDVLQSMKKTAIMRKLPDLKEVFVRHIENMLTVFNEGRILFDRYLEQTLNNKKFCVQGFRPRNAFSARGAS